MLVTKKLLINIDPLFKNIDDKTFIRTCNKTGVEVERIIRHHPVAGLTIVKILEINPHPNADRLHLVKIDLGYTTQEIVCGANNLEINKYAIYAPIGTKFKNFEIQEREIRGVLSKGMLCGYEEIFSEFNGALIAEPDKKGIVLFDQAEIGDTNINKYLNTDDVIYELALASNRNDLNAVLNFSKEFRYAYDQTFDLAREIILDSRIGYVGLKRIDNDFVSDASFIAINNIDEFKPTWKQKEILISCGYKIHNNWIDLMNLFSLYYGNPINIYDGTELNVNLLELKEITNPTVISNNQKLYEAKPGMFGIFYKDKLINLGGLLIDDEFSYKPNSKNIIIEISNYQPQPIIKLNETYKINNKEALIFAKPLSSWITQNTYNELSKYLKEKNYHFNVSLSFSTIVPKTIAYDTYEMYKFIGLNEPIHFTCLLERDRYLVHPSRLDVNNQYDVFEEVLKVINIDNLKPTPISFNYQKTNYTKYNNLCKLKTYLIDWGFYETKTYNLTSENDYLKFNLFNFNNQEKLLNPISKNREFLRTNLIDEQLKVIKYNLSRKRELKNIFEVQNINDGFNKYYQILSMLLVKDLVENSLTKNNIKASFVNIKSLLKNMFKKINVELNFHELTINDDQYNEIKEIYYQSKLIGFIFSLSNKVKQAYDLNELNSIYGVNINLTHLLDVLKTKTIKEISNYPLVYRDLNLILNNEQRLNDIIDVIKKQPFIYECKLKDHFIKGNNHIYTISLIIADLSKTLSSDEIDLIVNNINELINTLKQGFDDEN